MAKKQTKILETSSSSSSDDDDDESLGKKGGNSLHSSFSFDQRAAKQAKDILNEINQHFLK